MLIGLIQTLVKRKEETFLPVLEVLKKKNFGPLSVTRRLYIWYYKIFSGGKVTSLYITQKKKKKKKKKRKKSTAELSTKSNLHQKENLNLGNK